MRLGRPRRRGGHPSGREPGLGMGTGRGRLPLGRFGSERPQHPLPSRLRAAAPQRPRLAPLLGVCLTLNPSEAAADRGIPGGVNPGAGPQPRPLGAPPPTSRPEVPMGRRLRHLNGSEGRQGSTEGDPWQSPHCSPGAGKLTHALNRAMPSVFSAAFARVLYLDRLYLQYTCFRLVILEAGVETGQSRSSLRAPHVWKRLRLSAVEGSHSCLRALFPSERMRRKMVSGWKRGAHTAVTPFPDAALQNA